MRILYLWLFCSLLELGGGSPSSTPSSPPAFAPPFGAYAPLHLGRQTAASFPCRPRHQASRRVAPPLPSLSTTLRGATESSNADEALIKACRSASPDAVRAALAAGASPGASDDWGRTALQLGVKAGCAETAMVLLEAGADVSAASVGGDDDTTVLHTAALGGDRGMVELLLKNGADTEREDGYGSTAWDVAREAGHSHLSFIAPPQRAEGEAKTGVDMGGGFAVDGNGGKKYTQKEAEEILEQRADWAAAEAGWDGTGESMVQMIKDPVTGEMTLRRVPLKP